MRVLVTRPQPQADAWVQRLRADGVDAVAVPLLAIEPASDEPVQALWRRPAAWLVFVSPNAVAHAFSRRPSGAAWPAGLRTAAPGPGTASALRDAGVPPDAIVEPLADAGQFDSESLWQQLRHEAWPGTEVAVVRGDGGRDWLAERLREAGARVRFVQAYRRAAPAGDAAVRERVAAARADAARHLWLFSSSEAVAHLPALSPPGDWTGGLALASHPRIAQAALDIGFTRVDAVRPAYADVREAIRVFR